MRLHRLGPEGVLRALRGPLIEVWKLPDVGSHCQGRRRGASVGLEVPFGGRWSGVGASSAARSRPRRHYGAEDLDVAARARALWRREAGGERCGIDL